MLERLWANTHAALHALLRNITKTHKQEHKIVLVFSSGLECIHIGCSCGKTFFDGESE
jgi:hypothetical protein